MQEILNGFSVALSLNNLTYCFLGSLWGTMVGMLPGIGPLAGTAILIPLTFKLDPTGAIIMLAAIYYGSQYGGTITTVLMGVPGEASSAITMIDGYKMAKQGRGGVALTGAAIGSFIGGTFATICLMLLAKPVVRLALKLGPPEYFALMIVGLSMATGLAGKSMVKALIMTVFGALLALVGMDPVAGTPRLTFGSVYLLEGVELLSVVMGLFGMSEVLLSLEEKARPMIQTKLRDLIPTRQDVRDSVMPVARGTLIGTALGVIPGLIPPVSSFLSYAIERRSSKTPEKFGQGALEGVVGPETANNGHASAAMIRVSRSTMSGMRRLRYRRRSSDTCSLRDRPGSMVAGYRPAGDRRRPVSLERLALEPFSEKSQTETGALPAPLTVFRSFTRC